jgi:hypothetical protein
MKNSVVFRIDLLKNLKNIIPFSSINQNSCGDYLGDIEKIDFSRISEAERKIATSFNTSVKLIEEDPSLSNAMSIKRALVPSVDRVTRNFDCLSLTMIRVVSGIQSVNQLTRYLNSNSSAVVVYLDKPNLPLFEIDMTKEQFFSVKESKQYAGHLFLTADDLNALLKDEVFELLINPAVKTKGEILKPIAEEAKVECVEINMAEREIVQRGQGILAQIANGTQPATLTTTILDSFIADLGAQRMLNPVRETIATAA